MATKLELEEYLYRRAIEIIVPPNQIQTKKDYCFRKSGAPWQTCTKTKSLPLIPNSNHNKKIKLHPLTASPDGRLSRPLVPGLILEVGGITQTVHEPSSYARMISRSCPLDRCKSMGNPCPGKFI